MFIDQQFQADYMHLLFAGRNLNEERFTFVQDGKEVGEIFVYRDGSDMYIDSFNVRELHQRKGIGTEMINQIFEQFQDIERIWAMAEEDVLSGFWSKQPGFLFKGEGHDEHEGYFWFEINRKGEGK